MNEYTAAELQKDLNKLLELGIVSNLEIKGEGFEFQIDPAVIRLWPLLSAMIEQGSDREQQENDSYH